MQSFAPVPGLKVTGCSPSALCRMMEQFAVAGTDYLRLNCFAAGQADRGAVARSLADFLNCFMHCYTAAVVSTQGMYLYPLSMWLPITLLVCVHSLIQLRTVLHKHMMILRCAVCTVLCLLLLSHCSLHVGHSLKVTSKDVSLWSTPSQRQEVFESM